MAKMIIKKQAIADKALDTEPVQLKPKKDESEESFSVSLPKPSLPKTEGAKPVGRVYQMDPNKKYSPKLTTPRSN